MANDRINLIVMSNILVKRLFLAVIFLLFYAVFNFALEIFLNTPNVIFSLGWSSVTQMAILVSLLLLTCLTYIIFTSVANDWKIIGGVLFIAFVLPLILHAVPSNYLISIGFLVVFLGMSAYMRHKLAHYVNFQTSTLFAIPTKSLAKLLIIVIAFSYFLSIRAQIQTTGFQIPDALIEAALKFAPQETTPQTKSLPDLTSGQLDLLKSNPQLLKQYGLDPNILNSIESKTENPTQNLIKSVVKDQLQSIITPYQSFIPGVMAVLIFFSLISFQSLLGLLVAPLVWLIFKAFERSGFITFTREMREVKKMIV